MALFDDGDILDSDLLGDDEVIGDNFSRSNDDEALEIEEVTPDSLFKDIVEETIFDLVLEMVKIIRWKKENSFPIQGRDNLNPYNLSVREKVEVYQGNNINIIHFPCDHCGRKIGSTRYTYHLERCMRRRQRRTTREYKESGSEKEEESEEFDDESIHYEILPPPPQQIIEDNEPEVQTDDLSNGWGDNDNEDDDEDDDDDDEDEENGSSHRSNGNQDFSILGGNNVDDLVGDDDNDNHDDGFGISVMVAGSPLTPPGNNSGGLLSTSPLDLEGLSPTNGIIGDGDDDDQYGFGNHDLFGDDLDADDLHPPFSL